MTFHVILWALLVCVLIAMSFYHWGFVAGRKAAQRDTAYRLGLKCDYFFSYPGERCRLPLGHEGRHVPPVSKGDL
jgi:hypothetical protein